MFTQLLSDDACLLKREQFAITLRKQKKKELLSKRRLKYDTTAAQQQFTQDALLSTLCQNLTCVILSDDDDDIYPCLHALRSLLSSEHYISQNAHQIQSCAQLVDTVLLLASTIETQYMDLSLLLDEFTWLMINLPHICSPVQTSQLVQVLPLVLDCFPHCPDNCIQAVTNFLYKIPDVFQKCLRLFDAICDREQAVYSACEVENLFRLHYFCKIDFEKVLKFETYLQRHALQLVKSQTWKEAIEQHDKILEQYLSDLVICAEQSGRAAKFLAEIIDVDAWFYSLDTDLAGNPDLQCAVLDLYQTLAARNLQSQFMGNLAKIKVVDKLVATLSPKTTPSCVVVAAFRLLATLLLSQKFETPYFSLRAKLLNSTELMSCLFSMLQQPDTTEQTRTALETLTAFMQVERTDSDSVWRLTIVLDLFSSLAQALKPSLSPTMARQALDLVNSLLKSGQESVYQRYEQTKCIDAVELMQSHENEEVRKLATKVVVDNAPEGIEIVEPWQSGPNTTNLFKI